MLLSLCAIEKYISIENTEFEDVFPFFSIVKLDLK